MNSRGLRLISAPFRGCQSKSLVPLLPSVFAKFAGQQLEESGMLESSTGIKLVKWRDLTMHGQIYFQRVYSIECLKWPQTNWKHSFFTDQCLFKLFLVLAGASSHFDWLINYNTQFCFSCGNIKQRAAGYFCQEKTWVSFLLCSEWKQWGCAAISLGQPLEDEAEQCVSLHLLQQGWVWLWLFAVDLEWLCHLLSSVVMILPPPAICLQRFVLVFWGVFLKECFSVYF